MRQRTQRKLNRRCRLIQRKIHGPLAIDPRAFGAFLFQEFVPPLNRKVGAVTVVSVRGVLEHHACDHADSYDALIERWAAACSESQTVLLDVDSPGGAASGMLDSARRMAALAQGKRVVAYAHNATSAAYALCSVASEIWAAPEAIVGSVGVISPMLDLTAQDAQHGEAWTFVVSGSRKADTNPHAPLTDAAVAAEQRMVDDLAGAFISHVAASRNLPPEALVALQAGTMVAARGQAIGLVDQLGTIEDCLAAMSRPVNAAARAAGTGNMNLQKAIEALRAIAESENEVEAAAAKKMIATLEGAGDGPTGPAEQGSETEGPTGQSGPTGSTSAAGGPTGQSGPGAVSLASLQAVVAAQGAQLRAATAQIEASRKAEEARAAAARKAAIFATRPDLSQEARAELEKLDEASLTAALKHIPVMAPNYSIAAVTGAGTPSSGSADHRRRLSPEATAELRARMGLANVQPGRVDERAPGGGRIAKFGALRLVEQPAAAGGNGGK